MIIELNGWCVDREIQVLSLMLEEACIPPVKGRFVDNGFETEDDTPVETQIAIAEYFAPGKPVVKLTDQQKNDLAIADAYESLYSNNLQNSLAIAEIYELFVGGE